MAMCKGTTSSVWERREKIKVGLNAVNERLYNRYIFITRVLISVWILLKAISWSRFIGMTVEGSDC